MLPHPFPVTVMFSSLPKITERGTGTLRQMSKNMILPLINLHFSHTETCHIIPLTLPFLYSISIYISQSFPLIPTLE